VRDTAAAKSEKYANVAGFTVMALLGFPNLLEAASSPRPVHEELTAGK